MKRREPPDLSHVFDDHHRPARDSRPAPDRRSEPRAAPTHRSRVPATEKRIHTRFDKAFLVVIGSELYGDSIAIARNVSAGGILVEMSYAPPLGTVVTVHFQHAAAPSPCDGGEALYGLEEIVVRSEVKHHHYLNFSGSGEASSTRAIGLRFLEFVELGDLVDRVDPRSLH